jgi:D-glycero-D-manno-heptose 1,7-bisphosphate phosphatase
MSEKSLRAVFFDRDGVLNDAVIVNGKPHPPSSLDELHIADEASTALSALARSGFALIGVTNQPDVARGTQSREVVEQINASIRRALPIQEILTCFHDDRDSCTCRKPKPGLLFEAARRYSIDLAASFMIGDRWKDVEAGHRAGCRTVLIGSGYGQPPPALPVHREQSLIRAACWILEVVRQGE